MKKNNNANIAIILLLAVVMSLFALSGCSKNTDGAKETQSTPPASGNASTVPAAGQNGRPNNEEMQANIQKSLDALVSDGTITQEQSQKIAAAYLPSAGKGNGQGRTWNNQSGNTQNPPQNPSQNPSQSGDQGTSGQQRTRRNPLESLVNDGTLTQAQADKVMEALRQNFQGPQQ